MSIVLQDLNKKYIDEIKSSIRVVSNSVDDEIKSLIMAARLDLGLVGISNNKINDELDPIIKNAIVNYVRSEFGLNNNDSEKYRMSYNLLRDKMSLSQEYIKELKNELE